MTANYLEMEEKLASAQAKVKELSIKNTSLSESVKKIAAESIKASKQLKTVQAKLIIEKTLNARKEDHLAKAKKEAEDAIKNFKASNKYSDRLMVEYVDGFELLQKYLFKYHLDLNFSLLDIEEIEKEMLTSEAESKSVNVIDTEVEVRGGEGDARGTVPNSGDANVV